MRGEDKPRDMKETAHNTRLGMKSWRTHMGANQTQELITGARRLSPNLERRARAITKVLHGYYPVWMRCVGCDALMTKVYTPRALARDYAKTGKRKSNRRSLESLDAWWSATEIRCAAFTA